MSAIIHLFFQTQKQILINKTLYYTLLVNIVNKLDVCCFCFLKHFVLEGYFH